MSVLYNHADRPFSHGGPSFTYVDTVFDLTPYTSIVLQVRYKHLYYASLSVDMFWTCGLWMTGLQTLGNVTKKSQQTRNQDDWVQDEYIKYMQIFY